MFVSARKYNELHDRFKCACAAHARQQAEYEDFIAALQSELRAAIVDAENMKQKNSLLADKLAMADRIIKHYDAIHEADHQREVGEDGEWG